MEDAKTVIEEAEIVAERTWVSGQDRTLVSGQGQSRRRYRKRGTLETCTRHRAPSTKDVRLERQEGKTLVVRDKVLAKGFAAIPRVILRNREVTVLERLMYALLLDYAWQDGECFPGQTRLAKDLGVNERTVRRTLLKLQARKLISIQRQGLGKTNIYYIEPLDEYIDRHQFSDPGGHCGF